MYVKEPSADLPGTFCVPSFSVITVKKESEKKTSCSNLVPRHWPFYKLAMKPQRRLRWKMHCMVVVPRLHRTCCSWAQLHLVKCPRPSHCSAQGCARTNPASTNGWVGRCHPAACRSCGDAEMFHKNSVGEMLHESFTIP